MKKVFFSLMLSLLIPAMPWAQENIDARCTNPNEIACVDWENAIAIAIGTGAPAGWAKSAAQKNISATRAARLDAARNLLELIKGINLSTSTSVQGAMVGSDTIQSNIQGRLFGIRPVEKPKYFSDGSVQIKLEGRLNQIIPEELYIEGSEGPPREIGAPSGSFPSGGALSTTTVYTGLIIDARGTGVTPAMSPKVLDPEGREVYGSAYVSREYAVSQGVVGYVKSIEAARGTDRVKGNPAAVKALEARGNNNADLVISQGDADALRAISQKQTFLRESRVMIVLD